MLPILLTALAACETDKTNESDNNQENYRFLIEKCMDEDGFTSQDINDVIAISSDSYREDLNQFKEGYHNTNNLDISFEADELIKFSFFKDQGVLVSQIKSDFSEKKWIDSVLDFSKLVQEPDKLRQVFDTLSMQFHSSQQEYEWKLSDNFKVFDEGNINSLYPVLKTLALHKRGLNSKDKATLTKLLKYPINYNYGDNGIGAFFNAFSDLNLNEVEADSLSNEELFLNMGITKQALLKDFGDGVWFKNNCDLKKLQAQGKEGMQEVLKLLKEKKRGLDFNNPNITPAILSFIEDVITDASVSDQDQLNAINILSYIANNHPDINLPWQSWDDLMQRALRADINSSDNQNVFDLILKENNSSLITHASEHAIVALLNNDLIGGPYNRSVQDTYADSLFKSFKRTHNKSALKGYVEYACSRDKYEITSDQSFYTQFFYNIYSEGRYFQGELFELIKPFFDNIMQLEPSEDLLVVTPHQYFYQEKRQLNDSDKLFLLGYMTFVNVEHPQNYDLFVENIPNHADDPIKTNYFIFAANHFLGQTKYMSDSSSFRKAMISALGDIHAKGNEEQKNKVKRIFLTKLDDTPKNTETPTSFRCNELCELKVENTWQKDQIEVLIHHGFRHQGSGSSSYEEETFFLKDKTNKELEY